jgi:hypothetical protein
LFKILRIIPLIIFVITMHGAYQDMVAKCNLFMPKMEIRASRGEGFGRLVGLDGTELSN